MAGGYDAGGPHASVMNIAQLCVVKHIVCMRYSIVVLIATAVGLTTTCDGAPESDSAEAVSGAGAVVTAQRAPGGPGGQPAPGGESRPGSVPGPGGVSDPGLLYARVTTDGGDVYEGRIRWGVDEEALWSHYFNGAKGDNPWVETLPSRDVPTERKGLDVFGVEILGWDREVDLSRPFMARFGDISRIEPRGRALDVTLKSGATFRLDRFEADDLADGLQVWDIERGLVELGEWGIQSIEFMAPRTEGPTARVLHGTVRAGDASFEGLIQWNRQQSLAEDRLEGSNDGTETALTFAEIRAIERHPEEGVRVTTTEGRTVDLSGTRSTGVDHRGIYVDDRRFGRVLVSWDAFERLDLEDLDGSHAGPPAYGDFAVGRPLTGAVTTRSGEVLRGRLVYDLDESQTTETLDAPASGVDYTIPFRLVRSITLPTAEGGDPDGPGAGDSYGPEDGDAYAPDGPSSGWISVELADGRRLRLAPEGDLGPGNAGILVFGEDSEVPTYVPWSEVARIDFSLDRVDPRR